MIYLLHFDKPYKHARHYLGFVKGSGIEAMRKRLKKHDEGNGARLLQVITQAGIKYRVVRIWPDGTRTQERSMKCRGKGRMCPICRGREVKLPKGYL